MKRITDSHGNVLTFEAVEREIEASLPPDGHKYMTVILNAIDEVREEGYKKGREDLRWGGFTPQSFRELVEKVEKDNPYHISARVFDPDGNPWNEQAHGIWGAACRAILSQLPPEQEGK